MHAIPTSPGERNGTTSKREDEIHRDAVQDQQDDERETRVAELLRFRVGPHAQVEQQDGNLGDGEDEGVQELFDPEVVEHAGDVLGREEPDVAAEAVGCHEVQDRVQGGDEEEGEGDSVVV